MIAASKQDIREWFQEGVEEGYQYMLVIYDRMDYPENSDSPCYAMNAAEARKKYDAYRHDELCKVMEVYDLNADMEEQLAEKRAWRLPAPLPYVDRLPADLRLRSGETPLQFMEKKNAELIKKHFANAENMVIRPLRVFADDEAGGGQDNIYNICVYILEEECLTREVLAAVYRFTEEGGAQLYEETLERADEEDAEDFLVSLPQRQQVSVDGDYITFSMVYARGKDKYSPAYRQWYHTETRVFAGDYSYLGMHSNSGSPHVDKNSQKLYEQAMQLLHQAAEEGHVQAMLALSVTATDEKEAAYWRKRAEVLMR